MKKIFLVFVLCILLLPFRVLSQNDLESKRNLYPRRFEPLAVDELIRGGVPPEIAKKYPRKIWSTDIVELHKLGVSPKEVKKYPSRFWGDGLESLVEAGISAKETKKFPKELRKAGSIIELVKFGVDPIIFHDILAGHKNRLKVLGWSFDDFIYFYVNAISSTQIYAYPIGFSAYDVRVFIENNIPAETIEKYNTRYKSSIVQLVKNNISPGVADEYPNYLNGFAISDLIQAGISAATAATYKLPDNADPTFFHADIILAEETKKKLRKK